MVLKNWMYNGGAVDVERMETSLANDIIVLQNKLLEHKNKLSELEKYVNMKKANAVNTDTINYINKSVLAKLKPEQLYKVSQLIIEDMEKNIKQLKETKNLEGLSVANKFGNYLNTLLDLGLQKAQKTNVFGRLLNMVTIRIIAIIVIIIILLIILGVGIYTITKKIQENSDDENKKQ